MNIQRDSVDVGGTQLRFDCPRCGGHLDGKFSIGPREDAYLGLRDVLLRCPAGHAVKINGWARRERCGSLAVSFRVALDARTAEE